MRRWLWIIGCCIGMGACTAPSLTAFQIRDYREEAPIVVAAGAVIVQSDVVPSSVLPHIEKRMPVTPERALSDWAEHRFRAGRPTADSALVLTIQEASMIQEEKPSGHWYMLDNVVYELQYRIEMAYHQNGRIMQTQTVSGFEKKSIPEQSSLAAKEEVWQELINEMLRKVNRKVIADMPPGFILSEA